MKQEGKKKSHKETGLVQSLLSTVADRAPPVPRAAHAGLRAPEWKLRETGLEGVAPRAMKPPEKRDARSRPKGQVGGSQVRKQRGSAGFRTMNYHLIICSPLCGLYWHLP